MAEGVYRLCDEPRCLLPIRHVSSVDDGLATGIDDFLDDLLGGMLAGVGAIETGAEVVDDHLRAGGGKRERMLAAESAARAGDDDYATITDSHVNSLFSRFHTGSDRLLNSRALRSWRCG